MSIDLLRLILPKRKGYQLLNVGLIIVVLCIFGGYGEYSISPIMQVTGAIAGIIIIIMGVWVSHERSKYKSSRDRKL